MLVESFGASLVVGKLRGGKFSNIASEEIKYWGLIVSSFLLESATVFFAGRGWGFVKSNILYIHSLSYILLLIGLGFNYKKFSFRIMGLGVILNFIVILANGGQMPVSLEALETLGMTRNISLISEGSDIVHSILSPTVRLRYLADIMPFGRKGFLPSVISIGDILMSIGAFVYIQRLMLGKKT